MTENVRLLKERFPAQFSILEQIRNQLNESAQVRSVPARNGDMTLVYQHGEIAKYVHSQYNPVQEAENYIKQFQDAVREHQHVVFFGIGLGYYVEAFQKAYPGKPLFLFEPRMDAACEWLSHDFMARWNLKEIKEIYLVGAEHWLSRHFQDYMRKSTGQALLIVHPGYERVFQEEIRMLYSGLKQAVEQHKAAVYTNVAFEKRWAVNSAFNFPYVINSPNIFDLAELFQDKPALIVSAGPSLQDELEYIKKIKEERRAYIFAVGSANKALLAQGLKPDFVCTYDPQGHNPKVFEEMITQGIDDIPMIFGSTVGFETLPKFPGRKAHMVISQDTIAQYYLEHATVVNDAPSIAVVMLEVLIRLKAGPIILAGQNLALRDDQFYSAGIQYEGRSTYVKENEFSNVLTVKSVDGDEIRTLPNLNMMRIQMENVIKQYGAEVFNTTRRGAHIEGTRYVEMPDLLVRLSPGSCPAINLPDWYSGTYNLARAAEKHHEILRSKETFVEMLEEGRKLLKNMQLQADMRKDHKAMKLIAKWNQHFAELLKNTFYVVYVQPSLRFEFEFLANRIQKINEITAVREKAQLIVESFGQFLHELVEMMGLCNAMAEEVGKALEQAGARMEA